ATGTRVPGTDNTPRELSSREVQVLQLVADGQSNKEIGEALNLSALTVKSHLSRIGRKLGTGDRAQMVALAMRAGVIRCHRACRYGRTLRRQCAVGVGLRAVSDTADEPPAEAVLLREPREGVPDVVADEQALAEACAALAGGSGAIAVDTERASGYRYWPKAYLIQ